MASSLQQVRRLKHLHLCDIGVTWRSLAELEKVLLSCPQLHDNYVYAEKKSFPPPGEDITKVSRLTTMQLIEEKANLGGCYYGYQPTYTMVFRNKRSQVFVLHFYD